MANLGECKPVIDAHTHIFPDAIAEKAKEYVSSFYHLPMYTSGTIDNLNLAIGSRKAPWKIEKQLVCSPASRPDQTKSINSFIHESCNQNNKFIGFGTIHRDNADYERELNRIVDFGLKGVKFHFDFQKFNMDDEKMFPIYEAIARRNLPVLFHMGDENYDYSSPKRLKKVMEHVPNLKIIAAHMGGYQHWQEAFELPTNDFLYFDLSSTLDFITTADLLRMIRKFGKEHFFFGSDFPMWNPYEELYKLENMGLSKNVLRAIEYDNFATFMSI